MVISHKHIPVYSVFGLQHGMDLGDVADVMEAHAASIFRVETECYIQRNPLIYKL
jgi:ribosomal 30S subunit maturation factor RimM